MFGFGGNFGSCSGDLAPIVAVPESGGQARFWQDHDGAGSGTTAGGMWATAAPRSTSLRATSSRRPPTRCRPPGRKPPKLYDYSDSVSSSRSLTSPRNPQRTAVARWAGSRPEAGNYEQQRSRPRLGGNRAASGRDAVQAGKNGKGYLIEEAAMAGRAGGVQTTKCAKTTAASAGTPMRWEAIYIPCTSGVEALVYKQAEKKFAVLWHGPSDAFGSPIVSGGLVWDVASGGFTAAADAVRLNPSTGNPVYNDDAAEPRHDHFGVAQRRRRSAVRGHRLQRDRVSDLPASRGRPGSGAQRRRGRPAAPARAPRPSRPTHRAPTRPSGRRGAAAAIRRDLLPRGARPRSCIDRS